MVYLSLSIGQEPKRIADGHLRLWMNEQVEQFANDESNVFSVADVLGIVDRVEHGEAIDQVTAEVGKEKGKEHGEEGGTEDSENGGEESGKQDWEETGNGDGKASGDAKASPEPTEGLHAQTEPSPGSEHTDDKTEPAHDGNVKSEKPNAEGEGSRDPPAVTDVRQTQGSPEDDQNQNTAEASMAELLRIVDLSRQMRVLLDEIVRVEAEAKKGGKKD